MWENLFLINFRYFYHKNKILGGEAKTQLQKSEAFRNSD